MKFRDYLVKKFKKLNPQEIDHLACIYHRMKEDAFDEGYEEGVELRENFTRAKPAGETPSREAKPCSK
jgi:hypothetical protein